MPNLSAKSFLEIGILMVSLFCIEYSYFKKSIILCRIVLRDIASILSVKSNVLSEITVIKPAIKLTFV